MSQPESRYPRPLSRKPPKGHNIVLIFVSYKVDILYKKLVRYEYIYLTRFNKISTRTGAKKQTFHSRIN